MFAALDSAPPQLAHEALLVAAEGKLSKRLGAVGVGEMQAEGFEPMALLSLLARLGTSQPVEPTAELAPLATSFDFAHFGRAPAHFDVAEVEQLNARMLHVMPFAAAAGRVPAWVSEEAWTVLRTALRRVSEIAEWQEVVQGDVGAPDLAAEEQPFLAQAAALANGLEWSADPWHALTDALKGATDRPDERARNGGPRAADRQGAERRAARGWRAGLTVTVRLTLPALRASVPSTIM
jgi:glutamyl-tRNA synthetase